MSLVENLVYEYESFKLEIPIWKILDQGITVLSGDSGVGKTTIFRILIGLEKCSRLKWTFDGIDLAKLSVPEKKLGVVFQSLELFPHMTARQNILFAAEARKVSEERYEKKLKHWSETLQMKKFLDQKAGTLSGGEKQRVALVRAMISEPRMLLLDEAFSSLDEKLRQESREALKVLLKEEKIPALLITHDRQDIEALADKVSVLKEGRIVEE
ncbi:MAG: ATP-binding cassette domain-containing protein [Bdellovibrionota bacterium]